MKKGLLSLLIISLNAFGMEAQDFPFIITGEFKQTNFKSFIDQVESNHKILFLFDENDVSEIVFTAEFNETPLADCLDKILKNSSLNYIILKNNVVVIYPGIRVTMLFDDEYLDNKRKQVEPDTEKISRETLQQLRYKIFNVGIPGKNDTKLAVLSGHIKNLDTGEPVNGENVYIAGTQKGVSSDVNGYYRIQLPVGNHVVIFSCLGMEQTSRIINLYSDGQLDVEMELKLTMLNEAQIFAQGSGKLGQMYTGMEKLDVVNIKSIPSILGEPDIIKSVLTLPGVQTVGEGTSGFNVRGGNTDQNLILIDQATIYNPSHFFGNFSAFNSEIIDNATLYKGNMPVKYGGRISSVFEINTIEGNHKKITGSAGVSPISARINLDGPLFSDKSSFVTSFRSTYSNWILSQIKVPALYKSEAGFNDLYTKFSIWLGGKNRLLFNLYNSNDRFQLHSDTTYRYHNKIGSLILKHIFGPELQSSTSLIYSFYNYEVANTASPDQSFIMTHRLTDLSLCNDLEYTPHSNAKFTFGADFDFYSINPGEKKVLNHSNVLPVSPPDEHAVEYGIYAGGRYDLTTKLKVEGGARFSGLMSFNQGTQYLYAESLPYSIENIIDTLRNNRNSIGRFYSNPEWRLSLNYSTGINSTLKFSYNKTAQYIHMLSNTVAISPSDTWKLSDRYLVPETGSQISSGYFKTMSNGRLEVSAEVFYKWVRNIKVYKAGADLLLNDHIETEIVNGNSRSFGIELSLKKSGGRLYGRIDYTYSRTFIRSVSMHKEDLINDGDYFPANYDRPNNLYVLANLKASRRLIFSADLVYSTGRPITYPVAKYQLGDQVFFQYSKYNQYRISDYFRTDISVTVNGSLKKERLLHSSLSLSLYNLTARKNAYSVYFKSAGGRNDAYKLSIFGTVIPTVTYTVRF